MVCPDPLIGLVSCDQQSLEKNELGAQSLLTKIILRPNETFIRTRRIAAFSQEFNNFVLIFRINNVLNGIEVSTDVAVPLSFQLQLTPLGMDLVELSMYRFEDLIIK